MVAHGHLDELKTMRCGLKAIQLKLGFYEVFKTVFKLDSEIKRKRKCNLMVMNRSLDPVFDVTQIQVYPS